VGLPHGPGRRWPFQSGQGVRVRMGGRVLVNFSSDDYLDLATDPRLARAAASAARRYGCGTGASHVCAASLPPHRALERALAAREDCECAMVFESGLVANLALIGSLAGPGDVIFCDAFNSPGLIDCCYMSRASVCTYGHADVERLESLLRRDAPRARRRVIVTDTLFGMDGDVAPLAEILGLAERYNAVVVADETHASGVLGHGGRGLTDHLPHQTLWGLRLFKTSSFNRAFGSQGGFVCGPRSVLRGLIKHSRLVFASSALAVPATAAALTALSLADQEPDRRRRALAVADRLRGLLHSRGFPPSASCAQIVPVVVRSARVVAQLSHRLEAIGMLVPAIRPPLVARGTARLRISLTAGHTDAEVDRLVEALCEVRAALSV
jgi:8-amino-7-oxononanoate synthase